ncbi:unnamed protein product [Cochlearia groenlandica]
MASLQRYPTRRFKILTVFSGFVGTLDDVHDRVMVEGQESTEYWDRHGQTSLDIMVICDINMIFSYAWVSASRSTHDSLVLQYAIDGDPIFLTTHIGPPKNKKELFNMWYASLHSTLE